ncbi:glycosyltransferase family 39 protein [Salinisphaera sp.]|uniref:glycosyltransferase family 39 protein n=1 Tax=Salinisphaera sp. TaxID=1914330 RepID=UPI002D78800A|nr:glycosyltransferase family 39 protein [Salinisphaera sp.]HET7313196.1 glycosyltransferase family 39 protein [Salinisphaera sp.]
MKKTYLLPIFLVFLIITGLAAQFYISIKKTGLSHDGAITYLAASGKQIDYSKNISNVAGHWMPVIKIKKFFYNDNFFNFGEIKEGLVKTDIHPPLYFWLVHIAVWLFGFSIICAPLINFICLALTLGVIYIFVKQNTEDRITSLLAVAILCISPVCFDITNISRQYALFMLLSIILIVAAYKSITTYKSQAIWWFAAVFAACILGLLTHYYFILVITAVFLAAFVTLRTCIIKMSLLASSMFTGVAVFFLLMPGILEQFGRQQHQKEPFSLASISSRLDHSIDIFSYYFGWHPWWPSSAAVLLAFLIFSFLFLINRKKSAQQAEVDDVDGISKRFARYMHYVLIFSVAPVLVLYVFQFVSEHAMASRYLAPLAPTIAIVTAIALRNVSVRIPLLIMCLSAFLAVNNYSLAKNSSVSFDKYKAFKSAHHIVIDNLARGVALRELPYLDERQMVFLDWRCDLKEEMEKWASALTAGDVVVLNDAYKNSSCDREAFLEKLRAEVKIKKVDKDAFLVVKQDVYAAER